LTLLYLDKRRSQSLKTIHTKFFATECEYEVNVSGKTKQQIQQQVDNKRISAISGTSILTSLQRDCMNNLCDSFSRFVLTSEYKQWRSMRDGTDSEGLALRSSPIL